MSSFMLYRFQIATVLLLLLFSQNSFAGNVAVNRTVCANASNPTPAPVEDLNSLVADAPAGSTLILTKGTVYEVSSTVIVDKPLTIDGTGSTINYTGAAGSTAFSIQSSNVTLRALTIRGNSGTFYVPNSKLISTDNNSNESFYSNIVIENCDLSNFNFAGIYLRYVRFFTINNNTIYDLPYAGIVLFSCVDGTISGNTIHDITANGTTGGNSYGITVSRQNSFPTDTVPRNILVTKNEVSRVPWEGIDTHGADHFTVDNNRVIDCGVGIAIVSAGSTKLGASASKAPKFFKVTNNYIASTGRPGPVKSAIRIDGQDTLLQAASGLIEMNTCFGQGIKIEYTKDVIIRKNIVERPSSAFGILLNGYNLNASIVDNQIKDVWLANSGYSAAIGVNGSYNCPYIDGNKLLDNGYNPPAPAKKNSYGYKGSKKEGKNFPKFGPSNDFRIAGIAPILL